jgi:hypothetical protein
MNMGTVFTSYRSTDRAFVIKLVTELKNAGHDVWFDQWSLTGKTSFFWNEIQSGIDSCSHFLFVISPDSLDPYSGALKELYYALSLRPNPVIILAVAEARPVEFSAFPLVISPNLYQVHDFANHPYDSMLQRILEALEPALSTANPLPTAVPKAIFTEMEFGELGDLIARSGRVDGDEARRGLCNTLGIYPRQVAINGTDIDFAVNFTAYLYRTGNFTALRKICDLIGKVLYGDFKDQLNNLRTLINNLN